MAYNVKALLYYASTEANERGEALEPTPWKRVWCEATYSGGSRRVYAGRIVGEHQVVYTTYWRDGIDKCRFIEVDGVRRAIVDVIPEGRKRRAHIVTFIDDVSYGE